MKKIVIGLILSSVLTACGTESDLMFDNNLNQTNQTIEAQSRVGLNDTYSYLLKYQFELLDINGDKFISIDEFAPSYDIPNSISTLVPNHPVTKKQSFFNKIANLFKKKPDQKILNDVYARFAAVDKNKDLKVSLQEAQKQPIYFLGKTKDNLRDNSNFSFTLTDTNKDKKISKEEFISFASVNSQLLALFYSSDKNKNGTLSFSEYEDMLYAVLKFYASNPVPNEPPQQAPAPDPAEPPMAEPDPNYGNPNDPNVPPTITEPPVGEPAYGDPAYNS